MPVQHGHDTVVERGTKTKTTTQRPSQYKIVIPNDDYTPMDFVVGILADVFNLSVSAATAKMMEIHTRGSTFFAPYTRDVAETKAGIIVERAQKAGHPLQAQPLKI